MHKAAANTIDPECLHNSHAGELPVSEFMEPLGMTEDALTSSLAIAPAGTCMT
jgi:antitoxin HigA-1